MFRVDQEQQKALDSFFKEETTWFPNHILSKVGGIIFISISMLLLCFPYLSWAGDRDFRSVMILMYAFYLCGMQFLTMRYRNYKEFGDENCSVRELLKYFPISRGQLAFYSIRKIIKLCMVLSLLLIIIHLVSSMAIYGKISAVDIILPVLFNFVIPIIMELLG